MKLFRWSMWDTWEENENLSGWMMGEEVDAPTAMNKNNKKTKQ